MVAAAVVAEAEVVEALAAVDEEADTAVVAEATSERAPTLSEVVAVVVVTRPGGDCTHSY